MGFKRGKHSHMHPHLNPNLNLNLPISETGLVNALQGVPLVRQVPRPPDGAQEQVQVRAVRQGKIHI